VKSLLRFLGMVLAGAFVSGVLIIAGARGAPPLPVHQGHPILPVSKQEAKRERAMLKVWFP